jgi:hypothetical protein
MVRFGTQQSGMGTSLVGIRWAAAESHITEKTSLKDSLRTDVRCSYSDGLKFCSV